MYRGERLHPILQANRLYHQLGQLLTGSGCVPLRGFVGTTGISEIASSREFEDIFWLHVTN